MVENPTAYIRSPQNSLQVISVLIKTHVSVIQQDTQYLMINFIHNIWRLDMFRTSTVHLRERSYAVCCNLVCLDTL